MKIKAVLRDEKKKSETKKMRREGDIPAVYYAPGQEATSIAVDGADFAELLRSLPYGRLATTVVHLCIGNEECEAIVKEVQYHRTTYQVLHIDFEKLQKDVYVSVRVPINCVNVVDCQGVKLGGFIKQILRNVRVRCLPNKIPSEFFVDVKNLGLFQSKKLSELALPDGVELMAAPNQVAVIVSKR